MFAVWVVAVTAAVPVVLWVGLGVTTVGVWLLEYASRDVRVAVTHGEG